MIKYCRQEHHFITATHLQLGTLYYYQRIEQVEIADPTEVLTSLYELVPTDKTMVLPKALCEDLFREGIKGAGMTIAPGGRVNINCRSQIENCYIFCGTDEVEGTNKTALSLGYEAWYTITNIDEFCNHISHQLKVERLKIAPTVQPVIAYKHQPIKYLTGKRDVKDTMLPNLRYDAIFNKPTHSVLDADIDYRLNKEYRLSFSIVNASNDHLISVDEAPLLIPFTSAMKELCK